MAGLVFSKRSRLHSYRKERAEGGREGGGEGRGHGSVYVSWEVRGGNLCSTGALRGCLESRLGKYLHCKLRLASTVP